MITCEKYITVGCSGSAIDIGAFASTKMIDQELGQSDPDAVDNSSTCHSDSFREMSASQP
jgi:hypothetical protein